MQQTFPFYRGVTPQNQGWHPNQLPTAVWRRMGARRDARKGDKMIETTKTAKVYYLLSEAGRKQSLLQGGDGREEQVIETPVTPELLELTTVDRNGNVSLMLGVEFNIFHPSGAPVAIATSMEITTMYELDEPRISEHFERTCFDLPQSADQLIAWESTRRLRLVKEAEELKPALSKAVEAYKATCREREAKQSQERIKRMSEDAEQQAKAAEHEREKAEAKAAYEADRVAWVEANGSDRLKIGLHLNYNINHVYVEDRAGIEHPGFMVDYKDECGWKGRINPS
jgi:hypothetical protein